MTPPPGKQAPSPNHDARPDGMPVDILLLHYTGMQSAAAAVARLRDPAARVSSHYVVEEDGLIWQLVPGAAGRAWHAGVSLLARQHGVEVIARSVSRSSIPAMNGATVIFPRCRWRRCAS